MVEIDFDANALRAIHKIREGAFLWEEASQAVPARLKLADLELLGWEGWSGVGRAQAGGRRGVTAPIIEMARWGLISLRQAKQSERSLLWLDLYGGGGGDRLVFKMAGQDILVHSTPYKKTVQVCYEELLEAWKKFDDRVRRFILQKFPGIKEVPYFFGEQAEGWKQWLEGNEEVIHGYENVWDPKFHPYESTFEQIDSVESCS